MSTIGIGLPSKNDVDHLAKATSLLNILPDRMLLTILLNLPLQFPQHHQYKNPILLQPPAKDT